MRRTSAAPLTLTFREDEDRVQRLQFHHDVDGKQNVEYSSTLTGATVRQTNDEDSPMDLSVEDELQATVEMLRKTREENRIQQQHINLTREELHKKDRELEKNKKHMEIFNQEIVALQQQLRQKNEELEEINLRLHNQRESLANYQHYFAVLKNNRVNEDVGTPRVATPALSPSSESSVHSRESDEEEECLSDISEKYELQDRVTYLENQLIGFGEERQKERLELNEVLQSLEEVRLLRDEDSKHELVEQRLVESLRLLRSLTDLNMSRRTIGNLVVEAMDNSVNSSTQEISPLRFLVHLHRNMVEYERSSTEGLLRLALQAV